ncbi:MAG: hypothetical protein M1828_004823 [Chrysothrix sp. TS-e1954]|nr:MAG: hypothetical protein M1828_004823 [Chrysothrix sp. TS-e1954]
MANAPHVGGSTGGPPSGSTSGGRPGAVEDMMGQGGDAAFSNQDASASVPGGGSSSGGTSVGGPTRAMGSGEPGQVERMMEDGGERGFEGGGSESGGAGDRVAEMGQRGEQGMLHDKDAMRQYNVLHESNDTSGTGPTSKN